jgi:hypothetical protein
MYPCTDSGVRKLHMYRCTDIPDFSQKAAYHSGTDVPISVKKLRTPHVPMYRFGQEAAYPQDLALRSCTDVPILGLPHISRVRERLCLYKRKKREMYTLVMRPSWRIGTSVHLVPQPVHA